MVNEKVISRRYLNIKAFSPLLTASKKRIANIKILNSYVSVNISFQEVFIIFINNIKLDNRKTIVTVYNAQGYNYIVMRYLVTCISLIDRVSNDSSFEDWKFFDFVRVRSWTILLPALVLYIVERNIYLALFEDRLTVWGDLKGRSWQARGDDCKIYCCRFMRFRKVSHPNIASIIRV